MNVPLVLLNRRRRGSVGYNPAGLFALNEPGIWLDPSDLTTMFQDRAGSTAVTTPGQSVGLRLDKSKGLVLGSELVTSGVFAAPLSISNGVGANQVIGTVVGAAYRISYRITAFSGSGSVRLSLGTSGLGLARTATGTYSEVILTPAGSSPNNVYAFISATTSATLENISVKELPGKHAVANSDAARGIYGIEPVGGRRNLLINTTTMATQNVTITAVAHTLSFTGTGTVTLSGTSTAGPLVGTGVNDRVSLTFTPTAGTLTLTVSGSVTLAQLQVGSSFDAYQRVGTTQYDVTEAGKQTLHYVQYDGSDDGYVTPTITPGIDKVQVWAAIRKLSDSARGTILELSSSIASNNGATQLTAPNAASATYAFESKGTALADAVATPFAAPLTSILTGLGDISGDLATLRVNGAQAATSSADQGTGNYLAYPLYIGRRGGTTLPFNGRDYGIITRFGANLDASTIAATESWLNQRTGAF